MPVPTSEIPSNVFPTPQAPRVPWPGSSLRSNTSFSDRGCNIFSCGIQLWACSAGGAGLVGALTVQWDERLMPPLPVHVSPWEVGYSSLICFTGTSHQGAMKNVRTVRLNDFIDCKRSRRSFAVCTARTTRARQEITIKFQSWALESYICSQACLWCMHGRETLLCWL